MLEAKEPLARRPQPAAILCYRVRTQSRRMLEAMHVRLVSVVCWGILATVLASLVGATLSHEWTVLKTSNIGEAYPPILYGLMPSPRTSPVRRALGAAGGDFAQVYTSASALRHGESAYFPSTPEFRDRFGRPAGYPPLLNWLYVPLTSLAYYDALLVHVIGTLLGFFIATGVVLWKAGLRRHMAEVFAAQASLIMLTPIGFTHTERGQFDLVVATSSLLCVACAFIPRSAWPFAATAAFLGTLKWTSGAFLGCFCVLGAVLSSGRRRLPFVSIPLLMIVGTALFWRSFPEYWVAIRVFEIDAKPRGLTLTHLLPRMVAKVVPILVTLSLAAAAVIVARRSARHREQMLLALGAPVAILLMNLAICYSTVSYEYHTVTALGLLPVLVVWIERQLVPRWLQAITAMSFGALLCIAFRTFQYEPPFDSVMMTKVYAAFSAVFFAICGYVIFGPMRERAAADLRAGIAS